MKKKVITPNQYSGRDFKDQKPNQDQKDIKEEEKLDLLKLLNETDKDDKSKTQTVTYLKLSKIYSNN